MLFPIQIPITQALQKNIHLAHYTQDGSIYISISMILHPMVIDKSHPTVTCQKGGERALSPAHLQSKGCGTAPLIPYQNELGLVLEKGSRPAKVCATHPHFLKLAQKNTVVSSNEKATERSRGARMDVLTHSCQI